MDENEVSGHSSAQSPGISWPHQCQDCLPSWTHVEWGRQAWKATGVPGVNEREGWSSEPGALWASLVVIVMKMIWWSHRYSFLDPSSVPDMVLSASVPSTEAS